MKMQYWSMPSKSKGKIEAFPYMLFLNFFLRVFNNFSNFLTSVLILITMLIIKDICAP